LGRLESLTLDGEAPLLIRSVRDLETWLDRLAVLEPHATPVRRTVPRVRGALVTFVAEGERGICACLGNEIAVRV
jgi:hypothetical protein